MAVKIRLTRTGKKKQPTYRVVVMDGRKPRDGKYIEQIGRYDARQEPSLVEIDNERALDWLHKGAQPTERAQKLLEISGAWAQFRVDKGEIHTIGEHDAKVWPEKSKPLAEPEAEQTEEITPEPEPVEAEEEAQEETEAASDDTEAGEASETDSDQTVNRDASEEDTMPSAASADASASEDE